MKKKLALSALLCSSLLIAGGDPSRPPQRSGSASGDTHEVFSPDNGNPATFSTTPGCLDAVGAAATAVFEGFDQWWAATQPLSRLEDARRRTAELITAAGYTLITGETPNGDENDDDNNGATTTTTSQ